MGLGRSAIEEIVRAYPARPVVATVGSHSALDIADGAAEEGFRTLLLCQQGRDRTYAQYYRARRDATGALLRGCVDEVRSYPRFADAFAPASARTTTRSSRQAAFRCPGRSRGPRPSRASRS
jgi:5-formaminoimidazole-4-carboxamide-1-(beta)-D-ribofuranosyl 5'-monophosphate synthetase